MKRVEHQVHARRRMRLCIAVIDAAHARLFTFTRESTPDGVDENMTEVHDLVNPARRHAPDERLADTDSHVHHLDAQFARAIVDEIDRLLATGPARRLVLCASPHLLGILRPIAASRRWRDLEIDEVARDLVHLTPAELREHLATAGALPPVPARRGRA
jgi:protein required for attachment to host cells